MKRLAAALLLLSSTAYAGRRPFLYAYDDAMVPEGDVEIETWLDYIAQDSDKWTEEWRWWIGPRWSPIENVEIAALTVLAQDVAPPTTTAMDPVTGAVITVENPSTTQLWAEHLEGRWRFLHSDRLGSLVAQLDFRIGLANDVPDQLQPQLGWVKRGGRFVGTLQAGYARGFGGPAGSDYDWITWRAGFAVDVIQGQISPLLQLGIESFGEGVLDGQNDQGTGKHSVATLGPTLSIARGRLWLTAGVLFGLDSDSPQLIARGVIGLAL